MAKRRISQGYVWTLLYGTKLQALLGLFIRLGQLDNFMKREKLPYVKAFFAYILGMLTFSLAAIIIGILTDLIIKH